MPVYAPGINYIEGLGYLIWKAKILSFSDELFVMFYADFVLFSFKRERNLFLVNSKYNGRNFKIGTLILN